ncbi:MAG: phosphate/phosphite/phosphonate ABC transporter substrate-binding protein [bacterium]|nr:phosphate/phosphite/phosphonate ABC transporter substrate-binding protein [bacterium]
MKRLRRIAVLALGAFLLTASLSWAAAEGKITLRILLVPERNIFEQERKYQYLRDYTSSLLPMDVRFEVLGGYGEVIRALDERRADGAFLGSFVAALGIENHGLVPLIRPEWPSGETFYRSYIFKRSGTPITRDVSTWKNRSFVFVSPYTSAGYFFPLALLKKAGVNEPAEFFSSIQYSGSHDAAIWMVANDMVEMGAAKNTIYEELLQKKPELAGKIEILYSGGHFPDATLCMKAETPDEVREAMRSVFLRMSSSKEGQEVLKMFGAARFVPASTGDFGEVREVVKESGHILKQMKILN